MKTLTDYNKRVFLYAFRATFPVLLGYVPLGMAFGVMLENVGYNVLWGIASSISIFSGTGQFIEVRFLDAQTALYEVALLIIVLNSRMMFYGLSFLDRYRLMGRCKYYLIFGLTDETYALLTTLKIPEDIKEKDAFFTITLLNQLYWIIGSVIGMVAGSLIKADITGIDFVMTALFVVLASNQWQTYTSHEPVLIGLVSSILCLVLFGPEHFMVPALVLIVVLLIVRRRKIERKMPGALAPTDAEDTGAV